MGVADRSVTVQEVLQQIDAQMARLGTHRDSRRVLWQCRVAIVSLAARLPDEPVRTLAGIILP